ncbi:hypothetical protein MMAG44476_37743 [Mycolicibacterium mageritense DSM 44476 = CIP 104973]|uniref:Fibronectin attachment protein n=1 Tax=Mycolicibacterium mageritense TaxID=53462 RepID=A0AAI8TPB8_MYCME|nr:MAG: hypothetical protein E6Q55_28315 [Mycolicibacterium mageritense]BDY26122.1 hypothetical protein hbim_00033 [Mycolicibacterium mageritense]CDO24707.1 hypothetical protein BN978_05207 [Mycolicibacterium mageritense DSM 44476 = CIP 104973]
MGWSEVHLKKRLKLLSAVAGLTAAVSMGVLGAVASQASAGAQHNWIEAPMNTGATITESTPAKAPETSVAKPPFTFTTPEGFAVPH